MASIRDQIVEAGAARVAALGNGWEATTRKNRNPKSGEKLAIFVDQRESKDNNDGWFYNCTLTLMVGVLAYHENAAEELVYRYLDALVADVERAVHRDNNEKWGIPAVTDIQVRGHRKFPPDPKTAIAVAEVDLQVRYRHNIGDPDTYGYPPP